MDEPLAGAPRPFGSTSMLWVLALLICGSTAIGLMTLRLYDDEEPVPPMGAAIRGTTFDAAAASLRAGRVAEAYGRFVALAELGDVDAARVALLMYRFGPTVFGRRWDASTEQLAAWTRWSQAAEDKDMAHLVQWPARCDPRQSIPATTP